MPTSFEQALHNFAHDLTENFNSLVSAQPEDQLKAPAIALLSAAGAALGLEVVSRTEVHVFELEGRPDMAVTVNRSLTGHVELKAPGMGANPQRFSGHSKAQWQKFKSLPNLIYTDGSEWSLFRSGE